MRINQVISIFVSATQLTSDTFPRTLPVDQDLGLRNWCQCALTLMQHVELAVVIFASAGRTPGTHTEIQTQVNPGVSVRVQM
jgi:hypothetical protein